MNEMNERISKVLDRKGRHVETTTLTATVREAVERMNARRIGSLVVVTGDHVVGILGERDILARVVANTLDPRLTIVAHMMTRDPITVRPDTTVSEAMTILTDTRCRHLPVIDGGRLSGLISIGDLTSWMLRDQRLTIQDLHNYIRAA